MASRPTISARAPEALYRDHQVPPAEELHATKFINGRNRISTATITDLQEWKTLGRAVAIQCLEELARCPDIRVGAVFRRTTLKGNAYYQERGRVYAELVDRWNEEHRVESTFTIISMDGNGTDPTYFDTHRSLELDTRHIIEDPTFHDSRRSQLVQMADLVAYTAFMSLNRHPGNKFAWNWHANYLAASDVAGGPIEI
ncbi:DUF3800 domain-containing protein [Herbiconiux sp. VKM Ac-2851]|uniref:DUF3800 domain-containing protein n=1 Tax=Herbiconiux sp. VKM Ac-2851 TaxID=2739025 RepID=UPI001C207DE5|nr:DUF3800 domain-containing protein [Herbiconiux sp. VKM Ac-2851]